MNKMRILHVVATLGYGGVAQMLWRYYLAIDRRQVQFDFVSHGPRESFHSEIEEMGGRVFYLGTAGQMGLRRYVQALRGLIRDGGPYAAVHAHTNYQAGIVSLAGWLERVPLRICHIRGVYVDDRNQRRLPIYRWLIYRTCNVRLACSQQAGRAYYGHRSFQVIRNAVNLEAFERKGTDVPMVRQQLGVQDYAMILGHVGRFSIEKNHVFLLDVLQELRAGGVDACLVLVGDGPLQGKIASDAEVLGLQAHVRFTGVRQDIPDLLRAFNVLLLPSFSEGMPNVVLESQSAGTPALVSDTITPEVDVGLGLVSYASITSVSSWVNRLLAMQQILRPSPGQIRSAIRHAGFDLASSVKTLVNVYDRTALC